MTATHTPIWDEWVIPRAPGKYDTDIVSEETGLQCLDDTLTVQSDKDQCDINILVKQFGLTGTMPMLERLPITQDFVSNLDYKDALNALRDADAAFMELPADLRKRFEHDPGQFVQFCSDPANMDEIIKLGLAPPKPPQETLPPETPKATEKPVT